MPHRAEHAGEVAARRKADREHEIGIDAEFFRVVLYEFHRRRRLDKLRGEFLSAMVTVVDRIRKHERIKPFCQKFDGYRVALSLRNERIRSAGTNEQSAPFFVERLFDGRRSDICRKINIGIVL